MNPFCSSPVIMETAASYGTAALSGASTIIVLLGVFLPEIAILAGFLSDLMNVRVRHMPTSAFGVLAAVANWALALLIGPKPENASFFSLPTRNSVSPSSSPEAAAIARVGKLFNAPAATLLGVSAPLATNSIKPTSNPTRTVRSAATQAIAAATPGAPPSITSSPDTPTPTLALPAVAASVAPAQGPGQGKRSRVVRETYEGDDALSAWQGSHVPGAAADANSAFRMSGGAKLADIVNDQFNPCAVRGLGSFDVSKRPMGIAVLACIFFVYLLDMSVNKKRTTGEQVSYWFVAAGVLGANIYAYRTLGCVDSWLSIIVPLTVGLAIGGSAFAIYQRLGPEYLPMDSETPTGGAAPTGEYSACASGNGGDFVCDAYLNGERIGSVGGAAQF